MKTLISENNASDSRQRSWWQVRGTLRSALLIVSAIAVAMCLEPNLRSAVRVTLLSPAMELAEALLAWDGWLPLGFATAAGAFAAVVMRRTRPARQAGSDSGMAAA